jgi:Icc-related predicted phosphoesterase
MRVVCLSDTHSLHSAIDVPEGDLLVHAGDLTGNGSMRDARVFDQWLGRLPHRHKVVIAGNHDWLFEREPQQAQRTISQAVYLQDEALTIDGLKLWGSPWQPRFMNWAFNLPRGPALREKWRQIPSDVDLLITHGPPRGIRDQPGKWLPRALSFVAGQRGHAGCEELRAAVERIRPRLHVFGHIHEGYGSETRDGTTFVNASSCDADYRPQNPPIVLDL